jgi:pyruvate,water dikinase
MPVYIKKFKDIVLSDLPLVGGKNASLGELVSRLYHKGIRVPDGFAITADAFWYFIDHNQLRIPLQGLMGKLDCENFTNLAATGTAARKLITAAHLPPDLSVAILDAYKEMGGDKGAEVAVRSSATAEDLPEASFAGQHESYLNIRGEHALLEAVIDCFASLYTDRAIEYRVVQQYPHNKVALSVGVQHMVRADKGCSGIGFTLEPESGFRDIIHLSAVWGLGENIVQGESTPDEFLVFKPTLIRGQQAIVEKRLGTKEKTMIYGETGSTVNQDTSPEKRLQFVLTDAETLQLARWALEIERHYNKPMDIEWAKDGISGQMYIVQARPETVQSRRNPSLLTEYEVVRKGDLLARGEAVGAHIVTGRARVLGSPADAGDLQKGDIIITDITSPDWDPVLKKAAAIVTNKGGRTSHASIVARELGVPAVVGAGDATSGISDGERITVSCCEGSTGFVYRGTAEWVEKKIDLGNLTLPKHTRAMLIMADPEKAFELSFFPNNGVGLLRMEFIIANHIGIHPMALVRFNELKDEKARARIDQLTAAFTNKKEYFITKLSQGIATIAAAFYPKDVIVRMSDFKTNEYANLLGGLQFEPKEENPMLGFRGASRYYSDLYTEGFALECEAIRIVRDVMGLTNVKVMIPFCRTVSEGRRVLARMAEYGIARHHNALEVYVMAEIPSNVLLASEFAKIFDGFSIGSNDLTQLTLGIDRDSSLIAPLFNERDEAAKAIITMMIARANAACATIGFCGQAPSDFPEYAQFLVQQHIDSISFNADALLKGIENINKAEEALGISTMEDLSEKYIS